LLARARLAQHGSLGKACAWVGDPAECRWSTLDVETRRELVGFAVGFPGVEMNRVQPRGLAGAVSLRYLCRQGLDIEVFKAVETRAESKVRWVHVGDLTADAGCFEN
jgi:hypothetical protein